MTERQIIDRLLARKRELGLSQSELAKRAGIRQSVLSRIEAGGGAMTKTLVALADALGMSLAVSEESVTTYIGTPAETEAMLRKFYDLQRAYIRNENPEAMDTYERTMWRVDATALEVVAEARVRDFMLPDVTRMDTEREIAKALAEGIGNGQDVQG